MSEQPAGSDVLDRTSLLLFLGGLAPVGENYVGKRPLLEPRPVVSVADFRRATNPP